MASRDQQVEKMLAAVALETGLHRDTVLRVLQSTAEQGNGWLLLAEPVGVLPGLRVSRGVVRPVIQADWQSDDGETRSYEVYTDSDGSDEPPEEEEE